MVNEVKQVSGVARLRRSIDSTITTSLPTTCSGALENDVTIAEWDTLVNDATVERRMEDNEMRLNIQGIIETTGFASRVHRDCADGQLD